MSRQQNADIASTIVQRNESVHRRGCGALLCALVRIRCHGAAMAGSLVAYRSLQTVYDDNMRCVPHSVVLGR
eukprot:scaffold12862_cov55-Attheya_sp.AAC.1